VSAETRQQRRETCDDVCKERHVAVCLRELNNGDISVGSTDGLRRRFDSHQNGRVVSTSKYLPAARGASR
jgi:hypothetical protein